MATIYKMTVARETDGTVTRSEAVLDPECVGRVIAMLPVLSALQRHPMTVAEAMAHLVELQTLPSEVD